MIYKSPIALCYTVILRLFPGLSLPLHPLRQSSQQDVWDVFVRRQQRVFLRDNYVFIPGEKLLPVISARDKKY